MTAVNNEDNRPYCVAYKESRKPECNEETKTRFKEITKVILCKGATPLHLAVVNNDCETLIKVLNERKVDVNTKNAAGQTAFFIACYEGWVEGVRELIKDQRVDISAKCPSIFFGKSPIVVAVGNGHSKVVDELIVRKEIDVNETFGNNNITLLHLATILDRDEVVVSLLKHSKINPNIYAGSPKKAPLYIAVVTNNIKITKQLIDDSRTDVNVIDAHGWPPLITAFTQGNIEIMQMLLSHPTIDINKRCGDGGKLTPIGCAVLCANVEVFNLLFQDPKLDTAIDTPADLLSLARIMAARAKNLNEDRIESHEAIVKTLEESVRSTSRGGPEEYTVCDTSRVVHASEYAESSLVGELYTEEYEYT